MATNPNTKKLYQELRGHLLSKNKQKTCSVLFSILKEDPTDAYAKGELDNLLTGLNKQYGPILKKALAEKDRATLSATILDLSAYGDAHALSAHMPELATALTEPGVQLPSGKKDTPAANPQRSGKPTASTKQGDNPKTRELYKDLRSAIVSKNHEEAFKKLQEILHIDPEDANALNQKKETGKWLCSEHKSEIEEALKTHDENIITKTVIKFRTWADDEYLKSRVPSYGQAATIADAVRRNTLRQEFLVNFNKIKQLSDPKALNDGAIELEQFAATYGVDITPEQTQFIATVKEQWIATQHSIARQNLLNEAETAFSTLREDYARRNCTPNALRSYMADLEELHVTYSGKEQFPELTDFCLRVREEQTKSELLIESLTRKKDLILKLSATVSSVLVALGLTLVYAFASLDNAIQELHHLRANKQVTAIQAILEKPGFSITGLQRALSGEYQRLCNDCAAWINEFESQKAQLTKISNTIEAARTDSGTEALLEHIGVYIDCMVLIDKMKAEYGYILTPEEKSVLTRFYETLLTRKEAVLKSLLFTKKDMPMAELIQRNKLFASVKQPLKLTELEQEDFKNNLNEAVAYRLTYLDRNPWYVTEEEIHKSIQVFEKHAGELELDGSLLNTLNALRSEFKAYNNRDAALLSCNSLSEYKKVLSGFKTFLTVQKDKIIPIDKLKNTDGDFRGFAIELALKSLPDVKRFFEHAPTPELVKNTSDIFNSKSQDVFDGHFNLEIRKIIDRIVPPNETESKLWPKSVNVLEKNNFVYTYHKKRAVDKEIQVRILDRDGNSLKSIVSFSAENDANITRKRINLQMTRNNLGFIRQNLLQKKVSPVELMQNIIDSDRNNDPPLAKAYLYGECIKMLKEYENFPASGVALSATLRKDIGDFLRISQMYTVYSGCWLEKHPKSKELAWSAFFKERNNHQYLREINDTLKPLLAANIELVGYVNENGTARIRNTREKLYYLNLDDKKKPLLPYENNHSYPAFTPLFAISSDHINNY